VDNSVTNILLMNKENCALKLVDEIFNIYSSFSFFIKLYTTSLEFGVYNLLRHSEHCIGIYDTYKMGKRRVSLKC